jgi:branched-chain amino acid transport system permease protein
MVAGVLGPLGIVYVLLRGVFDLGAYYPLISGLGLILTAILNPVGVAGATREQVAWVRRRLSRGGTAEPPPVADATPKPKEPSQV